VAKPSPSSVAQPLACAGSTTFALPYPPDHNFSSLEVAPSDAFSTLEVAPHEILSSAPEMRVEEGLEEVNSGEEYTVTPASFFQQHRTILSAAAAILLIAAIIGGALGGTLGRASANHKDISPGPSPDPSPSSTPLASIRRNSCLAVTGWRLPPFEIEINLFYQGPDDKIRTSKRAVTGTSAVEVGFQWSVPVEADLGANSGTGLAAWTDISWPRVSAVAYYAQKVT